MFPCRYRKERLIPQADGDNLYAHETTTVFLISIYQYIGLVIAFSTAAPFRKSFLTNCKHCIAPIVNNSVCRDDWSLSLSLLPLLLFPSLPHEDWFVLCLVVLFPANLYLTLAPSSWWWKWFLDYSKLRLNSDIYFKIGLVLLALNHCVLAYFLEVCRQGLTKPHRSLMSPW